MSVAITKQGGMIKEKETGKDAVYYPIDDYTYKPSGTTLFTYLLGKQVNRLEFSDFTTPTGANIEEIADKLGSLMLTSGTDVVEVLKGNVPGQKFINVLGNNENLSGTNIKAVWDEGTDYDFPTVAATLTVESSDIDDVDVTGNGAREVTIEGLVADFSEVTEIVKTNGTTPVATTNEFIRVNKSCVTDAGTLGVNKGKITIKHGSNVVNIIRVGENRSDGAIYTVPLGKSAIIYAPSFAVSAGTEADVFVKFRDPTIGLFITRKILSVFENSLSNDLKPVTNLPEKSDMLLQAARLSGATPKVSGIIQVLLTDN